MKTSLYASAFLLLTSIAAGPLQAAPFAYVSNSASNNVSVIDLATNQVTATLQTAEFPNELRFSPDGGVVYVANLDLDDNVTIIDTSDNSFSSISNLNYANLVAVSPDASRLYLSLFSLDTINALNADDNYSAVGSFAGCPGSTEPGALAIDWSGSILYVTCPADNLLIVANAAAMSVNTTVSVNSATSLALSPDGALLYVGNGSGTIFTIYTSDNSVSPATFNAGSTNIQSILVNAAGTQIYATADAHNILQLDASNGQVLNTITPASNANVVSLKLNSDESILYAVDALNDSVYVIDLASLSVAGTITVGDIPTSIDLTPYANLSASVSSLDFGEQEVGTSSSQSVTLSNLGTGILTLTSNTLSAGFNQENDCGSSMVAHATCTLTITWTPTAAGEASGSITLVSNSQNGDLTINFTGTATDSGASSGGCSLGQAAPASVAWLFSLLFPLLLRKKVHA